MNIKKMNIDDLKPAEYNPRVELKETDLEYRQIENSIDEFGLVDPLIYNAQTGNLVSGHQRRTILKNKGVKEVYVSVVNLPLEKEVQLNLLLNKAVGKWDFSRLAVILEEMSRIPDFDIELTGFSLPEVSEILDRHLKKSEEDDFDFDADQKSIETPITQKGDLIVLGDHRLLCGDSADPKDVEKLMGGEKINLVFTDPPYSCAYYGGNRPHAKGRPKKCKNWSLVYQDNLSDEDYLAMLGSVFTNMNRHLAPGSAFYVFNGHKNFGPMHQMLTKLGHHISSVIVWAKPSFSISYGDYHQQVEFALYGWKEDNGAHYWAGPTNESTLWESKRDPAKDLVHATQKPVALSQRAIRNSSKLGDIVADFFTGSGSCLIGAHSLGRRFYGIEAEPKHCDSIIRRMIAFAPDKVSDDIKKRYLKGDEK